ncbi:MAG TPA: gliding motility-associated C-terminal domain-containing protein [Flavisolibacter sp.]|nr:gliding motility-associated C-terminal domain-containing protein [Flavisolibacter sp.]
MLLLVLTLSDLAAHSQDAYRALRQGHPLQTRTTAQCQGFPLAFGTSFFERGYDIAPASNNEFFAVGITKATGNDNIIIARVNASGVVIWSRNYGGSGTESVRKVSSTTDGGLLIAGQSNSFGGAAMLCFKINASGDLIWSRKFSRGSANGDLAMDIIETSDGGYAVSGIINVAGVVANAAVIKLNSAANIVWSKMFDRNGDGEDGVGIVQKGDTLVVAADLQNGGNNYSFAITKLRLTDGFIHSATELVPASRGLFNPYIYLDPAQPGYIISGHTIDGTSYANMKHTIIHLDAGLNVKRAAMINISPVTNDFFTGIIPLADGSFIGSASPQSGSGGYIYRVGTANNVAFSKRFKGALDRRIYRLLKSGDDILGIGGTVVGSHEDIFLAKLGADGSAAGDCDVEDVAANIIQPTYNVQALNWGGASVIDFSDIAITLPSAAMTLAASYLCPVTPAKFDFSRDVCKPKTVQFTSSMTGVQSYEWRFGDGQTNTISTSPFVTYQDYGTYEVELIVRYNGGCSDTVAKNITVSSIQDNGLVLNGDTTICLGDSVLLRNTTLGPAYCWNASTGSSGIQPGTYVKPTELTTYTFSSSTLGPNLITNASFSSGNAGFQSQHVFSPGSGSGPGTYSIGPNPLIWGSGLSDCKDHTTGSGNMMMVNGSSSPDRIVWSAVIAVSPNTDYQFSTWLQNLNAVNTARLQFAVNGQSIGTVFSAGSEVCSWRQFSAIWNAGSLSSATISVICVDGQVNGNDFALDDLFFGTVQINSDVFTVDVKGLCDSISIEGPERICSADETFTYAIYRAPNCTQPFMVEVDGAFVDVESQTSTALVLTFKQDGVTRIRVRAANDCKEVIDSLDVSIRFSPSSIDLGPDVATCQDTSFLIQAPPGFENYSWQDGSQQASYLVNSPGSFEVTALNFCGVQVRDVLVYTKRQLIPFAAQPINVQVCIGDSVSCSATGGAFYQWQPAAAFASPQLPASKALVSTSQDFTVFIQDPVCFRDTLIIIPVTAIPLPQVSITKTNDVNCTNDSARLIASGASSYSWSPNPYITRQEQGSITVKPPRTQTFYLEGEDPSGCKGKDSVVVEFRNDGEQRLFMPSAFTPNGDGLNDFFRPTFIGPAVKYEFRVYNRWGQLVFQSNIPGVGWNGIFNSAPQPKDVYVYYIKAEGGCKGQFEQKGTFALIR